MSRFLTALLAQNRDQEDLASELRTLRLSYRDAMVKVADIMRQRYMQGSDNVDGLLKAQTAFADAEATVAVNPAERIAALESSVASLKELEPNLEERLKVAGK